MGRGEKRYSLSYRQLETSDRKDINYRQSLTQTNSPKLSKNSFESFNIHTSTSSIMSSSPYIYLGDQQRSEQQTQSMRKIESNYGNRRESGESDKAGRVIN